MLVLSRRLGERVVLTMPDGRRIDVCLVDVDRGKVRLGFTAPADVTIHRLEIQAEIDSAAKKES